MRPALLVVLAGCIENTLNDGKDDPPFDDGDDSATVPVDTSETGTPPDDTGTPPVECPDAVPADGTVAADTECSGTVTPFDGDLVERWRAPLEGFATEIGAARVVDGNGDGVIDRSDPMSILADELWGQIAVFDADGNRLSAAHAGSWRVWATAAEIDAAHVGTEVVSAGYFRGGPGYLALDTESGVLREMPVDEAWSNYPWVTDLEGDGSIEVLLGNAVVDAATGVPWFMVGAWNEDITSPITADLDRDGLEEILLSNWEGPAVGVFNSDGTPRGTCVTDAGPNYSATWAVGNLDGDDDGEFLAAGDGYVALCDSDGALLAETDVGMAQPGQAGLAQLDDDLAVEIVLQDQLGMVALDDDLSELWRHVGANTNWYPFSLADLDQDGHHEILVHESGDLVVLDAGGAELARHGIHAAGSGAWRSQPIVVDLDGDGLAEIVVAGDDLVVLESPAGGWPVRDAEYPWPAGERHPGDRDIDGSLNPGDPFWLDPERNVWQGLPVGRGARPELALEIEDVCVEACDGEAVVTARVSNRGVVVPYTDIEVALEDIDRSEVLGTATVVAPEPGVSRAVVFRIPADRIADGLRATADPADRILECDVYGNVDEYRDAPCP